MAGLQDVTAGNNLPAATVDEIAKQGIPQYASTAARDADATLTAALREGIRVYLIDANCYSTYTGSGWSTEGPVHGAPFAWTPGILQSASVPHTVSYAKYARGPGRLIQGTAQLVVSGAGGVAANAIKISGLPQSDGTVMVGTGRLLDLSATLEYPCELYFANVGELHLKTVTTAAASGYLGNFVFTAALAAGDTIDLHFRYFAATDA